MNTPVRNRRTCKVTGIAAACLIALLVAPVVVRSVNAATKSQIDMATVTITAPISADKPIPVVVRSPGGFTISLPSNVTTGYSWRRAGKPNDAVIKLQGSKYEEAKTNLVGRGGVENWIFTAVGKGKVNLKMECGRPWEKNVKPAKSQTFAVTVL